MDFSDLRDDAEPQPWPDRPEGVILEGVVGSRAYGLDHEGSDEDRLGVFLAPSVDLFGLDDITETMKNPWADEVLHELGKFCRLALKVNPTVTEVLWLEPHGYLTRSRLGDELVWMREAFLSAPYCRNAYLGYAASQFAKLKDRGDGSFSCELRSRTAKHARHLARLLTSGYGLWSTGRLRVRLDSPQWYQEFGEQVAGGDLAAAEELLTTYERMFDDTATVLPAEPARDRVDAWLRDSRARSMRTLVG